MNKLLSTLILSIGMSLSATAATSLLDSSIVGYSDFASQTADFGTLKDSVSITSDDSNLTLSGITFNGYGANNRDVMSVTMVLDLSKINTPDAYTALFNAKNSSVSWGVGLNTDRKLQGLWNNTSYSGPVVDTPLGTEGSLTISVVTGDLGTRIYFGDSTTYYSNSGLKFGNQQIDQILMDAGLAESIEQLYIHDSLLSQEQVGQLMSEIASIPEGMLEDDTSTTLQREVPLLPPHGKNRTPSRDEIIAALKLFGNNRSKVAQYLGISRRTLQYKLKEYQIPPRYGN